MKNEQIWMFTFLLVLLILPIGSLSGQNNEVQYTITDLAALGLGDLAVAWGINSSGEIGGERITQAGPRPFVFRNQTLTTPYPVVPFAQGGGVVYGINDAGDLVGAAFDSAPAFRHSYLYTRGNATDLHNAFSLGSSSSFATAINTVGDFVGASVTALDSEMSVRRAFVYRNGAFTDLHPLVSFGGAWSEALGINDLGDVVGAAQTAGGDCFHAFLRAGADGSVADLHSTLEAAGLPIGGCESRANGINGNREIVGSVMLESGDFRAFFYSNGAATDLNSLIPSNSGWLLEFANGISNTGQIVGFGRYMGQPRPFLLTHAVAPQIANGAPATVADLLNSPGKYAGRRVMVKGRVRTIPRYSRVPCPDDVPDCNPISGVAVFLEDLNNGETRLPIYQKGSPYGCYYDIRGNYDCRRFVNNTVITLEAVYAKSQEPAQVIGSSSPSTGPSAQKVLKFRDFYFLDVGP